MTSHPLDDLAVYAIGGLDEPESDAIAAHLRDCDSCRAELEAYERTVWRLAEAVAQEPPSGMRAAVVERARAEGRAPARRGPFSFLTDLFLRPVPLVVPIALALVVALSLAAYGAARRDADRYATALAGVQNARVVALAPSAAQPAGRGTLVVPSNGAAPYLLLDLPPAPSGKTWQAWVIRGDAPLPAGTSGDLEIIFLTVPVQTGDVVAVTLEDSGGATKPTTTPVLTGKAT